MTVRYPFRQSPSIGPRRGLAAIVLLLVVAAAAGSAAAQSDQEIIKDREAKRRALQEDAAAATENLDAATAEAEDLIDALNRARAAVEAQQTAWAEAERAVIDTKAVLQEAGARIAELEAQLLATQEGLREAVIKSYVSFQAPTGTLSLLGPDLWRSAREEALAGFATGSRIDDIDELRRLGGELERWRRLAADAAAEAEAHRQNAVLILAELEEAASREAELSVAAEERVERRLYEIQSIKQIDAEYAAEIEAAERRIAEALARRRAEEEARRLAALQGLVPADADFTLVEVRGITVNSVIADETDGLLAAMETEGFDLHGWGFRTHNEQIRLRRANCGTSEYAVWQMPASRCRPPTARPGRSNHERGLAIDFTSSGRLITSRSSSAFQALRRIAPQYGFKNLPSEPWHWSVDGN